MATQLLGCPYAALVTVAADGSVQENLRLGSAPSVPTETVAKLALFEDAAFLTDPDDDDTGTTWSVAGIVLVRREDEYDALIASAPPSDPFDQSHLPILRELAACASAMQITEHRKGTKSSPANHAGLPDRSASTHHLDTLIARSGTGATAKTFGIFRIDLDHLSQINTRHGWDTADLLIGEMIERIQDVLPEGAFLGHFGGGGLLAITPPNTSIVNTRSLVLAIMKSMDAPVVLSEGQLGLSVSLGWAMFPQDGQTIQTLFEASRAALAEAAREGGGHERRADASITARYLDASTLEQDLFHAINNDGLHLTWMPIIAAATEDLVSFEALLRWNREGHGPVAPDLFVRCAEEAGMIEQLDAWSLRAACTAAMKWDRPLRLSVNISPVWLVNERLAILISTVLAETGLPADRLQIELSERRSFGPSRIAHQELSRIRALGVRIAFDDFGAGYSSLTRLGTFPIDQIKLDRSFVQRLGDDTRVDEILRATLQLAHALDITCCAKGIETESQLAFLDAYGCEEIQGYLLGQPVGDRVIPASTAA